MALLTSIIMDRLPLELLEQVFLQSDSQDLLQIAGVCKKWRHAVQDVQFLKKYIKVHSGQLGLPEVIGELSWPGPLVFFAASANPFRDNMLKNVWGEEVIKEEMVRQNQREPDEEGWMLPWPNYPHWDVLSSPARGWTVIEANMLRDDIVDVVTNSNARHPHREIPAKPRIFNVSEFSCVKRQVVKLEEAFFGYYEELCGLAKLAAAFGDFVLDDMGHSLTEESVWEVTCQAHGRGEMRKECVRMGELKKLNVLQGELALEDTDQHVTIEHGGFGQCLTAGIWARAIVRENKGSNRASKSAMN